MIPSSAVPPRPWRVVRLESGATYIVDAEGNRLCSPDSRPLAGPPMRQLVTLANEAPTASVDQVIEAAMRLILAGCF